MRSMPRIVCGLLVLAGLSPLAAATDAPRVAVAGKHAKLSSELRDLAGLQRTSGTAAAQAFAVERGISLSPDATVQVVIQTTGDVEAVKSHVRSAGGTFETAARDLVLARVPVASLESLASAAAVRVVRRPRAPALFQTTSEGVSIIGAPAWHSAGRKGAGVKVAILDVGFEGYSSLMGSELPQIPSARIRSFSGGIGGGEDHGTAVAEVVYDVAPAADLYLANFSNEVELENAVDWLIEQGVDVINASWGYPCGGPVDGTGRGNDVVKRAAEAGILWVNAAGNMGQRHWSAVFNDSNGNGWHNFAADADGNPVYMNAGDELRVCVEWDDWTNKDQDLELYVWDNSGTIVNQSTENQGGPDTHDPWERLDFTANTTGYYYIGVKRDRGTRNPRLQLYAYEPGAECALETAASTASPSDGLLSELRQFRDVVLRPSPTGRAWIDAYYRHSREVRRILLLHPRLAIEAASLLSASRPAVRSVLAARSGQPRDPFVFAEDYAMRVDRFLEQLIALGSPRLRDDLDAFRTTAAFATAAGQPADLYWDRLLDDAPSDAVRTANAYPEPGYMRYTTTTGSIIPPADSAHAFTAGAVDWSTGALEEFSSLGPTVDGRRKPDLVAPNGVCTVTVGECGANGFRGTSASAPHVAGAAALVWQAYPTLSLTALRSFLTGRAVDIGPAGPDDQTGAGRLALGSTTDVEVLPAPTLSTPTGSGAPISPTYTWSEVSGAASYRLMVAASASALPADPAVQTCTGCLINTTTSSPYFTPEVPLLAAANYSWQVQGRAAGKNGLWARASFTTSIAPELTPPARTNLPEETGDWPAPAGKAVVITHGWNAGAVGSWVQEMAQKMCGKLGAPASRITNRVTPRAMTKMCQIDGWDLWVVDWSEKADTHLPWNAFANATQVGEMVADNLEPKNYSQVHFIAHSAGSNLIDFATIRLKGARPGIEIHATFMDAYEPTGDSWRYGSRADWTDNYVDTRDLVALHFGLDGTRLFLDHGYNVDVTPSGLDPCIGSSSITERANCRHSRPFRFYGKSVNASFVGNTGFAALDPISGTGGMGYPLSTESFRPLSDLRRDYANGKKCTMTAGICVPEDQAGNRPWFRSARVTRAVNATAGVVTYVIGNMSIFDRLKLGIMPQSSNARSITAATEAASWIVVDVTTAEPVNKLRFRWRFGSTGEGLLRVFVDGMLVREIDQRYVPFTSGEAEEIYAGGATGTLAPGSHRIVFRLDGFGANASGVELTAVDLGMAAPGTRRRVIRH